MKLDFRHPELFANPIHLLAVHLCKLYGHSQETSTEDTFLLYYKGICMILTLWQERPFPALRHLEFNESCIGAAFFAFLIT